MKQLIYLTFALAIGMISLSCKESRRQAAARSYLQPAPSRSELIRRFRDMRKLLIVYPARRPEYRQLGERLQQGSRRGITLRIVPDTAIRADSLEQWPVLLVGTPENNRWIADWLTYLPLSLEEHGFRIHGKTFNAPSNIFTLAYYPHPLNAKLPIFLLTGNEDRSIIEFQQTQASGWRLFRWSSWGFSVRDKARRLLLGFFEDNRRQIDHDRTFDFTAPPDTVGQSRYYTYIAHHFAPESRLLTQLKREMERSARRIRSFTGTSSTADTGAFELHLYPKAERKGLQLNDVRRCQADLQDNRLHLVANRSYAGLLEGGEQMLLLRHLLGAPSTPFLERGLSVYFTRQWQGSSHTYWARRLSGEADRLSIVQLWRHPDSAQFAPLAWDALSAAAVDFLIQKWGREQFLERYGNWEPSDAQLSALDREWTNFLQQGSPSLSTRSSAEELPTIRGFNFAHEGYSIYNGYVSREASRALSKMRRLGSNAAAIVPYSYLRDPRKPGALPIPQRAGSENDESVIHSLQSAKAEGMLTVLKPQIWLGGGSWPGDIRMQSEAGWRQFFEHYYRWIRHYAILAEIYEVDLFVIGTEFAKATLERPGDWRRLIRQIRRVYSGPITYAANWGAEFEHLTFWPELDLIGLNCYYPLSEKQQADEATLRRGFRRAIRKAETRAEEIGRPLLFTEIGFRSIEAPWIQPHADTNGQPYNGAHQSLCYEIVMEAIHEQSWCKGILWWKFPSFLDDGGNGQRGFTPNKKPAERVIREWFPRMGQ